MVLELKRPLESALAEFSRRLCILARYFEKKAFHLLDIDVRNLKAFSDCMDMGSVCSIPAVYTT